jgi:hypothetical protein
MTTIAFADGAFEVDANIVAEGLGIAVPLLQAGMRSGAITTRSERGLDADQGRHRLTFFSGSKRFRLVIEVHCKNINLSTLHFVNSPLPRAAHRPSG